MRGTRARPHRTWGSPSSRWSSVEDLALARPAAAARAVARGRQGSVSGPRGGPRAARAYPLKPLKARGTPELRIATGELRRLQLSSACSEFGAERRREPLHGLRGG